MSASGENAGIKVALLSKVRWNTVLESPQRIRVHFEVHMNQSTKVGKELLLSGIWAII